MQQPSNILLCNAAADLVVLFHAMCCDVLQMWRQHWDFQLYKALDVQYRVGLESINKTLPEVGSSVLPGSDCVMLSRQNL